MLKALLVAFEVQQAGIRQQAADCPEENSDNWIIRDNQFQSNVIMMSF